MPLFTAEHFDAGQLGGALQARGRAVTSCPWPSTTTASRMYDCALHRLERGQDGAAARRDRRAGRGRPRRGPGLRRSPATAPSTGGTSTSGMKRRVRRAQDPRFAGLYARRGPEAVGRGESRPTRQFLEDWLARTERAGRQATSRSSSGSTGGSSSPPSHAYLQKFAAYYYNRGAAMGQAAWPSTTRSTAASRSPTGTGVFDVERGQLDRHPARSSGRPTPRSRRTSWGYVAEAGVQDDRGPIVGDLVDIVSKNGSAAAQHRAAARRHDPRARGEDAPARSARWLARERRGDLRHAAVARSTARGPTEVVGGLVRATPSAGRSPAEDIRFTARGGTLYATLLAWPESGRVGSRLYGRSPAPEGRDRVAGAGGGDVRQVDA